MSVKRASIALAVLCAAFGWSSSASALSYSATCSFTDAGGFCGTTVNHFITGPGATGGGINTDTIAVNLTGPGPVGPSGSASGVQLTGSGSNLSQFDYLWFSDNNPSIQSGSFSLSGSSTVSLPFSATINHGDPYSSYHLWITTTTSGSNGGGYVLSLAVDPCGNCQSNFVPVPPAAVLFVSGLAGLGLLGRRRRKSAQ